MMDIPGPTTIEQSAGGLAERCDVLAAAFAADPVYRRLLPRAGGRRRGLRALFRVALQDAERFGAVDVAVTGGRVQGVAVWLAPGAFPLTAGRKVRATPGLLRLLVAAPPSFAGLARLGTAIESLQPPGRSWYLQALGVAPAGQGRGVGGRLLRQGLDRADRDGAPATLETASVAAAVLYRRAGFMPAGPPVQVVAHAPAHQLMRRPAGHPLAPAAADRPRAHPPPSLPTSPGSRPCG